MKRLFVCERTEGEILIFEDYESGEAFEISKGDFPALVSEGDFFEFDIFDGKPVEIEKREEMKGAVLRENKDRLMGLFDE